jgi:hypothetical protein
MVIRIIEELKEGEWLGHVEWMLHETIVQGYHNEQPAQLPRADMYMYTKQQTE